MNGLPQAERRASSPSPGRWQAEALWQQLTPLWPGFSIEVVATLPSTNTALLERLRTPSALGHAERRIRDDGPMLLVAERQTAGRGRMGRTWQSTPDGSLTFSLALSLRRPDLAGLSLAVGLALARALDPQGQHLGLKWPNDLCLLADGRKLGGVLIEAVQQGAQRQVVIGVGLNVQPQPSSSSLPASAALAEWWPEATPPLALAALMPPLAQALQAFDAQGFAPLVGAYAERDVLCGHPVTTTDTACPAGVALGVDEDGALKMRAAGGQVHRIVSGEVSVRTA